MRYWILSSESNLSSAFSKLLPVESNACVCLKYRVGDIEMMLNIKYISHQFEYGNVLNGSQTVAFGMFIVAVQRLFFGGVWNIIAIVYEWSTYT